ncbi:MAG: hypothetical protein H7070_17090 [Saprospiraceae bacterium]|nr:hypothetical protein [Pyrinomonadaceae bacterium]
MLILANNLLKKYLLISVFICVHLWLILLTACGSKPTDIRTVIPADALIYLEADDLGKAVSAIAENKMFQQMAKSKPDLSALKGIKIAVAVTGFETSEQPVTEENSVLNFQPRFVAVVETNAWNFQAVSFTENKLGEFINEVYGGGVELETSDKNEGKYFIWTSQDGRKAYALVQGSVIFFGNDESAIEKCLAAKRGESDSIAKNPKVTTGDRLAFGYVSNDGIAQIANLAGIHLAMASSEEGEVKSFVARVLPEILRGSVKEVTWTAAKTETGIEDKFTIATAPEVARVFDETLVPAGSTDANLAAYLPADVLSATRYDLKDPQIAWRSVLLTAQKQTDSVSGNLIAAFSGSLFEPFGIEDAELMLSSVGPQILTGKFDTAGENVVVIATVKEPQKARNAIAKEISFARSPEKQLNADVWKSDDGEISAAFIEDKLIIGDAGSVLKCLQAKMDGVNFTKSELFKQFSEGKAVSVTAGKDFESAGKIVEVLAEKKAADEANPINFVTETRFNKNGIERRTVSDFGLIGSIIEQFGKE